MKEDDVIMLQANILFEELDLKTIHLTIYENGVMKYAHLADNNSIILELLQKFQVSTVNVGMLDDSPFAFIDMDELIVEIKEQGIEVLTNALFSSVPIEVNVNCNDWSESLDDAFENYIIIIDDDDNSNILINSLLDNGYIISYQRINSKLHLKVHGATGS